jgi:hypothetical protein
MKTIEILGRVDENHRLTLEVPAEIRPGPVKVTVEWPEDEDPDGTAWSAAVGTRWTSDWTDPREDIYSLEDGKPTHEPR